MNPSAEDILAEDDGLPIPGATQEEVDAEIDAATPEVEIEIVADDSPLPAERAPFDEAKIKELEAADEAHDVKDPIVKRRIKERIDTLVYHVKELEHQRETIRSESEEVFKYANGARGAMESLAKENVELKKSLQREALAAREARLEVTQREFQAARESNDAAKEGEIAQRLATLAQERAQISQYTVEAPWAPPPPPQRQQAHVDAASLTPATNKWLSENRWFTTDASPEGRRMRSMATDLSQQLEAEGVAATSEVHYTRIDAELRRRFPERFGYAGAPMSTPAKPQPAARPQGRPPVATAQRTNGAVNGTRKVVLTASQVAADKESAAKFGVSVEAFQRAKYRKGGE